MKVADFGSPLFYSQRGNTFFPGREHFFPSKGNKYAIIFVSLQPISQLTRK